MRGLPLFVFVRYDCFERGGSSPFLFLLLFSYLDNRAVLTRWRLKKRGVLFLVFVCLFCGVLFIAVVRPTPDTILSFFFIPRAFNGTGDKNDDDHDHSDVDVR